jgi:hypothetical protein
VRATLRLELSLFVSTCLLPLLCHAGGPPLKEQAEFLNQVQAAAPAAPAPGPAKPAGYSFSDGDAEGRLGDGAMRRANKAAAEILKQRMEQSRPDDLKLLAEAGNADVVVVSGTYDRVQDVLRAVDVKHVVVPPHLLARLKLLPTQTLMVNCPGRVPDQGVALVRDFVRRGGYLVTTDWALLLTARAFPGTIRYNSRATSNDVVAVHVHDGNEPLLQHVKVLKDQPRWWLESSSYPIQVLDPHRVRVLMSSDEMKKKYGEGAVVVAFKEGDGKVLHMTSHFYLQQAKLVAQSEKQSGGTFARGAGLGEKELSALRQKGVDVEAVRAGELNSAYSMQQVSANLLVEKQKANRELLARRYRARMVKDTPLSPAADGKPQPARLLKKDYRVEVVERRDGKARVRDLFGNEGWVPQQAVAE